MMGWLSATPRAPANTTLENAPKESRGEVMKRAGITPAMPEISASWFIDWLTDLGFVENTGMGSAPIGWITLRAWQDLTGTPLQPWEARLIRKLSSLFISARSEGEDPLAQPPFYAAPVIDQEQAQLQLRVALMSAAG
jgi:hypothetical protein